MKAGRCPLVLTLPAQPARVPGLLGSSEDFGGQSGDPRGRPLALRRLSKFLVRLRYLIVLTCRSVRHSAGEARLNTKRVGAALFAVCLALGPLDAPAGAAATAPELSVLGP